MTIEFPGALKDWRQRRRVSQLELALRSGTTQRHISFLESGRSTPGRGMVVRLAESLEVPLRERNSLLLAAGFAPAYPETGLHDPGLAHVRAAMKRVLRGHEPYPAIVIDRRADVVLSNDAFTRLFSDVAPHLLTSPINVARILLHPEGLAPRILNLDVWAWHVIDGLRRRADETLDDLIAELETYVPSRPKHPGPDHLGFAVPLRLASSHGELQLLSTLSHFGTAIDVTLAELRLEAFLPGDDQTASILASLASLAR